MFPFNIFIGSLRFVLLVCAGLLLALGLWFTTPGSLGISLALASRLLPSGLSLTVADVSGSVHAGGRIGSLRWEQDGLRVEATDALITWRALALLQGKLEFIQLSIGQLRIDDRRPPSAPQPPADLKLPLSVLAPFHVGTLIWEGPPKASLSELSGIYAFDSNNHRIDAGSVQFSSGKYQFSGQLGGVAQMGLEFQLAGTVPTTVPGSGRTLTLVADARITGALAGTDAQLEVRAHIAPQAAESAGPAPTAPINRTRGRSASVRAAQLSTMQATVTAVVHPWRAQPLTQAQGNLQSLDLSLLWPGAPHTRLDGEASVQPVGTDGWRAQARIQNEAPGTWDAGRLPLERLVTTALHDGHGWRIETLRADTAGGQILANGQLVDTSSGWSARGSFENVDTARLDGRLERSVLSGQLEARQSGEGVAFDLRLHPGTRKPGVAPGPLTGLHLEKAKLQGIWNAARLRLSEINVQTDDARFNGTMNLDLKSYAADGQLSLTFPGGEAALSGNMAPDSGQGTVRLLVADAARATRWLARWPGLGSYLKTSQAAGAVQLDGSWQGGWAKQGRNLQVQALVSAERLEIAPAGTTAKAGTASWKLSDLHVQLQGAPAAWRLTARTQAAGGTQHLQAQAAANGALAADGSWRAQLESAGLQLLDTRVPGTWTAKLEQPVEARMQPGASGPSLDVSAGALTVSGPQPGTVRLDWQPATGRPGDGGLLNWQSRGQLEGLPLNWMTLLTDNEGGNLSLRGDILLGGQWDLSIGNQLRLRASVERRSGDLRLQTDEDGGIELASGVREARVSLNVDNEVLTASLLWDSRRGGRLEASANTRLNRNGSAWNWAPDAPLAGTLTARLPRIGGWSVLAPPGWRLRGTLDASAMLAGTRDKPLWTGTLKADDLAVRSVVDGVDFSKGSLRASLDGQRVDIQSFTIRGASDADGGGGELSATGFAIWPPLDADTGVKGAQMELDVRAKGLRVSTRSDLRLAVSGDLKARLQDARFILRGKLTADQARFILPDDTAPSLGSDVMVRRKVTGATTRASVVQPAGGSVRVMPDVSVTLDLGSDFQVKGHGLTTRLEGGLVLHHETRGTLAPRLTGQIRTVQGTYKAYGQQLTIEEGVLRFSGPYDNPALEVRAIRPNTTQRVGVEITGTVLSPRVRLFSEPDMPDAEKLSWLLLGRGSANGGAEAAILQQAALALIGSNGKTPTSGLTEAFGLDELSVRGESTNADGSTSAAAVSVGKRLSKDFYIAYEHSLGGAMGSFSIFYDLTRRLTLRASTGENASVDLIFTIRYD